MKTVLLQIYITIAKLIFYYETNKQAGTKVEQNQLGPSVRIGSTWIE